MVLGISEIGPNRPGLHVAIASGPGFERGWLSSTSTLHSPYVQLIDAAPTSLQALGASIEESFSEDVPAGTVISTDPTAGASAGKGSDVTLVVSKGPVLIEVPRLATQSVDDARETLEGLGFVVKVEKTDLYIGWDRVVRQSPGGGEMAPKGSTITLSIV